MRRRPEFRERQCERLLPLCRTEAGGRGRKLPLRRKGGCHLLGVLLSGPLAGWGGMAACRWGSAAMLALCLAITFPLPSVRQPQPLTA